MSNDISLATFIADNVVLIALAFALLGAIIYSEGKRFTRKFQDVTPNKAVQLMNNGDTLLLDVREAHELAAGQIAGAKQIPASAIDEKLGEIEGYKDKTVIAFCANGLRAVKACQTLAKNGFLQVYNLKGGLTAWSQANLPVTKK